MERQLRHRCGATTSRAKRRSRLLAATYGKAPSTMPLHRHLRGVSQPRHPVGPTKLREAPTLCAGLPAMTGEHNRATGGLDPRPLTLPLGYRCKVILPGMATCPYKERILTDERPEAQGGRTLAELVLPARPSQQEAPTRGSRAQAKPQASVPSRQPQRSRRRRAFAPRALVLSYKDKESFSTKSSRPIVRRPKRSRDCTTSLRQAMPCHTKRQQQLGGSSAPMHQLAP